jgi:ubiquinone/menaquinone biosynthesis C-methylase UbiE
MENKPHSVEFQSNYQLGTAEAIPFPDSYFDMVTCQTVLIHVKDITIALNEMLRVLKPGGLLAVAEPNNLVSRLIFNNLNFNDSVEDIINPLFLS